MKVNGTITGSGTLQIENGATLALSGSAYEAINFIAAPSATEKLTIADSGGSFGTISGFAAGNTIDPQGIAAATDGMIAPAH